MQITVLKAKFHQARVTHSEPDYEGSCAIDGVLLDKAGIHQYEQIQIYNISNGERLTTYAIRAENNSRIISMNGAAAHKSKPGEKIIICSYGTIKDAEINRYKPVVIHLDAENNIVRVQDHVPIQVA